MNSPSDWLEALEDWMLWAMIGGIGWPIGLILSKGLLYFGLSARSTGLNDFLNLLIGGVVIALFQIMVLAPDLRSHWLWVLLTTVGWLSGTGVTWLLAQAGDSFFQFGWLIAGLVGGLIYGGMQVLGFHPWVTPPMAWMSKSAMQWIAAYAMGVLILGGENNLQIFEFLFISWSLLALLMFTFNLLIIPKRRRMSPPDGKFR